MTADTMVKTRWVYTFGGGRADGDASMKNLLGGKGANLLAGYKRAVNILKAEEKKGPLPGGEPCDMAGAPPEEVGLVNAIGHVEIETAKALEAEDFSAAMRELAALRAPVDAFFDKVLVNSEVAAERENRLRLLAKVRDAMGRVADFSQVTG